MPDWYKSLWHILATGFLPALLHLLVNSANLGLLSKLYTGLQRNMEMLGHAENPGRSEGGHEEDMARLLDDLPSRYIN